MANVLGLAEVTHGGAAAGTLYEVTGLATGHEVFIRRIEGQWKVIRVKNGVRQSWSEGIDTLEEAFAIVRSEYETAGLAGSEAGAKGSSGID